MNLTLAGPILAVVGAVAFVLAYGDRLRLKTTIESLMTTVAAYKEENAITKQENGVLRAQVGECQGAIRILTETVTQSAKVEMLSHVSSDQHRAIILKLDELGAKFAGLTSVFTEALTQKATG